MAFVTDVLGPTLGVRLPRSPDEWIAICAESGLHNVRFVNGVEVYAHGYGIELGFGRLSIDFDWGDCGEPDGFDVWRLYHFARLNHGDRPHPEHPVVRTWVEEAAAAAGELTQDRYLYYSPSHRAGGRQAEPGCSLSGGRVDRNELGVP